MRQQRHSRPLAGVRATAVIPSASNRAEPWTLDLGEVATRNLVERYFGRLRELREVATRHARRVRNFLSQEALAENLHLPRFALVG